MVAGIVTPLLGNALAAALALGRTRLSRNRNLALLDSAEARNARRLAARIRGIVRHLRGVLGRVGDVRVEPTGEGVVALEYAIVPLMADRSVRLGVGDLSVVRVALEEAGVRLLPGALVARDDDRARVGALLASWHAFERAYGEGMPEDTGGVAE